MSYLGYIPPGDHGRVCDVCARLRPGRSFRVVEGVWICDFHPSYVPQQVLDRVPYRSVGVPSAIPNAKTWAPNDTHETTEAAILNLILRHAPTESLGATANMAESGTATVQGAAWSCLYLHALITEAQRPVRWVDAARVKLRELADWLVAAQKGGPETSAYASSALQWGAYNRATSGEDYYSEDSAAAGLALLRAYQVLGSVRYLAAARACAWFLRSAQCGDKLASRPSSTASGGSPAKHWGMWTHRILLNSGTYDFDHRYYPADLIGLEFLQAFKDAAGDETIGSSTTNSVFNASRAALVSTAIAEALAFWTTGAVSVDDGATIVGLSSATPREFFDSYPTNKGAFTGRGSWQFQDGPLSSGTLISGTGWAIGLRALRAVSGDAAVTSLFDWLMTFSSNSAYELASASHAHGQETHDPQDDGVVYAGSKGTYDPKTALASLLLVRTGTPLAATTKNGSSLYDLGIAGILGALYAARQPAAFKALKLELCQPRPRFRQGSDRDGQMMELALLGRCGLSFQPWTSATEREVSTVRAAQVGLAFRHGQHFLGRGN